MAYQSRPYPELTWSLSRHNKMRECCLQYYYYYYQAHNGWERNTTIDSRQAYLRKQLTSMYKLFGESMHKMSEYSIREYASTGSIPKVARLTKGVRKMLNSAFVDSTKNKAEWELKPKEYTMLEEIFYDGQINPKTVEKISERVDICASNFLDCETMRELAADDVEVLELEQLNDHMLYDVKNYVKIDLMYRIGPTSTGTYRIVDWKTGNEEEDKNIDQMLTYAVYVVAKYGISIEQIEFRVEYLLSGKTEKLFFTQEDIDDVKIQIGRSIDDMKSLCYNSDMNQPKDIMSFIPCPTYKCGFCQFRGICPYSVAGQ